MCVALRVYGNVSLPFLLSVFVFPSISLFPLSFPLCLSLAPCLCVCACVCVCVRGEGGEQGAGVVLHTPQSLPLVPFLNVHVWGEPSHRLLHWEQHYIFNVLVYDQVQGAFSLIHCYHGDPV
jgi:hypothetical protein